MDDTNSGKKTTSTEEPGTAATIISAVVGAAASITAGAMSASAASEASAEQKQQYERGVEYQKERDKVTDVQWKKEFGLKEREFESQLGAMNWQKRQAERQIKVQSVKDIGAGLTNMSSNNIAGMNALWNMWGGRRNG